MNSDDFEKQLQQQPMRTIPSHWRAGILEAVRAESARECSEVQHHQPVFQPISWWREYVLPLRWHLAGLGAVWMLVAVLNAEPSPRAQLVSKRSTPSPAEVLMALRENRRQLLELLDATIAERTTSAAPRPVPSPRSELQSSLGLA